MGYANTDGARSYERWYPSHRAFIGMARRGLREFAERCGFSARDLEDITSAVGEALANAVEHGHNPVKGFTLKADCTSEGIAIEIRDFGQGFGKTRLAIDNEGSETPAPRGYGLLIMQRLMDRVEYRDRGTCVVLHKRHRPD